MNFVKNIKDISSRDCPLILAMGCFDGVHIGHQKVISVAVEQAKERGGDAWVFTFNPHPAKLLCPDKAPPLISAEPCRLRQFEALGVSGIIEIPFTRDYAQLSPEAFLTDLIEQLPNLSGIVCGQDWSFGHRASGTFQTLETFGKQHGFTATGVTHVLDKNGKISSTDIRNAVLEGNIPEAERMLGRPFSLFGTVIHGNKVGRELGFPTANIDPLNELLPGSGVYTAYTRVQNSNIYPSAVFVGKRETFGCHKHVIESYLIDFDNDLYDQIIEVSLVEKIRDVTPFPSREALMEQIQKDVELTRSLLNAEKSCVSSKRTACFQ
ncbi:MAG: bifunctional riboflavin kinase/FAD synthetase [Kiritimatiellaceae bacterium]|nr:bifunctional riboflavin kinase/FAD synthetase [Kiritimatiellaceae bacterium]